MRTATLTKGTKVIGVRNLRFNTSHSVFMNTFTQVPNAVVIHAMFLINTKQLRRTKSFVDYAILLFNRFVSEHFKAGVNEVHIVFDTPNTQAFNPKQFEHSKRHSTPSTQHEHASFSAMSDIPQAWREYLECRRCKRSLTEALGHAFLQKGYST